MILKKLVKSFAVICETCEMSETHHRFENSITIDIIGGHIDIKDVQLAKKERTYELNSKFDKTSNFFSLITI